MALANRHWHSLLCAFSLSCACNPLRFIGNAFVCDTRGAQTLKGIAERVETRQVLEKLGSLGVEFAQGYYIARPSSVASFEPWANNEKAGILA